MHYTRWRRHGDPLHSDYIMGDDWKRFWQYVDVQQPDECWEWQGHRMRKWGYGMFNLTDSQKVNAHRHAYELLVGPIADGLHIDHLCVHPPCVNPNHLEPVTPGENVRRARRRAKAMEPSR